MSVEEDGFVKKTNLMMVKERRRTEMGMEVTQMAMEMGMGALMGSLMVEAEAVSLKRGVLNTKNQSIVIIQKDSLSEHTVGVEKKVSEQAVSKKQQKFFGIVRAIQKGEIEPTTPETAEAARNMKKSDVEKFASTKHKGLPERKEVKEESNPRIPRKKGQPANSKKHSDLYTDENPKGTIHGLGFKDVANLQKQVLQKSKNQVVLMLIKSKQQLLWNKEQELWVKPLKQQYSESSLIQ